MSGLRVVSQAVLDSWGEQEKIDLDARAMTSLACDVLPQRFACDPAGLAETLGGVPGAGSLLAAVTGFADIRAAGGEPAGTSRLHGGARGPEPRALTAAAILRPAAGPDGARAPGRMPASPGPHARPSVRAAPLPLAMGGGRGAAREFHLGEALSRKVDPLPRAAVAPALAPGANES